jgi:hypothetical protein
MKLRRCILLLIAAVLFSCKVAIVNIPADSGTIGSIDIPSPEFFWLLRPWKKGTLATMNGKARFSEISFSGKNRIKITSLINFPEQRIDRLLLTAPESGICITNSSSMFFIADTVNKKTNEFMPIWGSSFNQNIPNVLDAENGIIIFRYYASDFYRIQPRLNIIYDVKNDKTLYRSPKGGEENAFIYPFSTELILCAKYIWDETENYWKRQEYFLYNWKTKETIQNELTKFLTGNGINPSLSHGVNIDLKEHYMFANFPIPGKLLDNKKVKITWDENYEDIKVIPLDYLIHEGQYLCDFFISSDGKWAMVLLGGYDGYYGESLYKTVFFHLDSRYPNGMSMPIFTEDYDKYHFRRGAFFEHPEYGWCYADEKHKEDDKGKEKLYLRLYKMSDVLEEINRNASKSIVE